MAREIEIPLRMEELCQQAEVTVETIVGLVEYGIIEPSGDRPKDWVFDIYLVSVVKRACRLQRDFNIDLSGIALVLDLLDQLEKLRAENKMLEQRLKRFILDE